MTHHMEAGSPFQRINMDKYLKDLTDNLIGVHRFAPRDKQFSLDYEEALESNLWFEVVKMTPETLGRVMCAIPQDATHSRRMVMGRCGIDLLRIDVAHFLAQVIIRRLDPKEDRRRWPKWPPSKPRQTS